MNQLIILFLHHVDDDLTRHHARLIQELNPEAVFVPLAFQHGFTNAAHPIKQHVDNQWRNTDRLIYQWFSSSQRIESERYWIVEYDTLCLAPVKDFYAEVWDEAVSCARVLTLEDSPDWCWFQEIPNPMEFNNCLLGMSPVCGILLSYAALAKMSELSANLLFDPLFCECRIGTLARSCGFFPRLIRQDIDDFISWQPRLPTKVGIWHSVKTKLFSSEESELMIFKKSVSYTRIEDHTL